MYYYHSMQQIKVLASDMHYLNLFEQGKGEGEDRNQLMNKDCEMWKNHTTSCQHGLQHSAQLYFTQQQ